MGVRGQTGRELTEEELSQARKRIPGRKGVQFIGLGLMQHQGKRVVPRSALGTYLWYVTGWTRRELIYLLERCGELPDGVFHPAILWQLAPRKEFDTAIDLLCWMGEVRDQDEFSFVEDLKKRKKPTQGLRWNVCVLLTLRVLATTPPGEDIARASLKPLEDALKA